MDPLMISTFIRRLKCLHDLESIFQMRTIRVLTDTHKQFLSSQKENHRREKRKGREWKAPLSLERMYKDEATHDSLDFSFQTMIKACWNMKKSTKLNFSTLSADHRSKLCEQH